MRGGPEAAGLAGYCPVPFPPPDRRAPSRDTERAMSQENVEVVRRTLTEFDLSLAGIKGAARAGLVAPDVEVDFSALYPDGPVFVGSRHGTTT
jgi:hypothetical protein